jgi:L-aminopeptidase/D-esterase-like protein
MTAAPGKYNAITDVTGIKVGQAHDEKVVTGVTVIVPDTPCMAAIDVRGGGPGTRESDAMMPEGLVDRLDALVLSGGSVYGLAAADAVAAQLGAEERGFSLVSLPGVPVSPIVPSAILYDLANGGDKAWGTEPPYRNLGANAFGNLGSDVALGRAGAGYGARAGAYQGGLGSASIVTEDGWQVGAIAAVNSFGSPYLPGTKCFWAWPNEIEDEFGGIRPEGAVSAADFPPDTKVGTATEEDPAGQNTTICAVAVNARLTKMEAKRLAIMAQDGLARAIRPAHAPTDGDVVFALATGEKELPAPQSLSLTRLGTLAADCLARAIARGVYEAAQ